MPVLSGTTLNSHGASCSSLIYLVMGCTVLFVGAIILRRKRIPSPSHPPPNYTEKAEFLPMDLPLTHSHTHAPPPLSLSPHALPFTPPVLFTSSFSLQDGVEEKLPSNEYYDSPTEMNFSSFDSFEPLKMAGEAGDEMEMPRRRSYTKTSSNGSSISGEILQAPSFRRHTRVYGSSSPCLACEESERRMSA